MISAILWLQRKIRLILDSTGVRHIYFFSSCFFCFSTKTNFLCIYQAHLPSWRKKSVCLARELLFFTSLTGWYAWGPCLKSLCSYFILFDFIFFKCEQCIFCLCITLGSILFQYTFVKYRIFGNAFLVFYN